MTRELFFETVRSSAYDECRESISFLAQSIEAMEKTLIVLHDKGLPKQLIHGDLHYENMLAEAGVITGVLDFEVSFCLETVVQHARAVLCTGLEGNGARRVSRQICMRSGPHAVDGSLL